MSAPVESMGGLPRPVQPGGGSKYSRSLSRSARAGAARNHWQMNNFREIFADAVLRRSVTACRASRARWYCARGRPD